MLVWLTTACASDAGLDWCVASAGEPVTVNTGASRWDRQDVALRFTESWRRGGTNEGEELIFPFTMAISPVDGRLALADFQLAEAIVVGEDGTWEGAWTRAGRGPGEVQAPLGVAWDEEGRLVVYDIGRHRLIRLSSPHTLDGETEVPPEFGGPVFQTGGLEWTATLGDGTIFLEPMTTAIDDRSAAEVRVLRWTPGTASADTIVLDTVPLVPGLEMDMVVPGSPRPVLAPAADGRLAVGGVDARYRIRVQDAGGSAVRTICRAAAALPLTPIETGAEKPSELADGPETERMLAVLRASPRPDPPAPFGRMFWGSDGRLWVQRERPEPNDIYDRYFGITGATWDVFDSDGDWLGQASAPPGLRLMAATAETAYALEEATDGALWLVALRLDLVER
jgi:hypothetical protein